MKDFRVFTQPVEPQVIHRDDGRIVYRVAMSDLHDSGLLSETMSEPIEWPVAFSFVEYSWWPFVSPDTRPFVATALFLPEDLGSVRAVFSATDHTTTRRSQTRVYNSRRVRTPLIPIERGSRRDTWRARPSEGWRIAPDTVTVRFKERNRSCHSGKTGWRMLEKSEQMIAVRVRTVAERGSYAVCRTRTTISFEEWRTDPVEGTVETEFERLRLGHPVVLELAGEYERARLAYIDIQSPILGDEEIKRYPREMLPPHFEARYDEASQSVYFAVRE